ncbi:THAP domain-containing protein 1-like isoform X2 [Photinus pyralis]|uniref:THAP domain-containing protein 1-like isoform X2 n=1 Tax=Photinus pyralis TaxID=7054 RepID=UPI0012673BE4|nr:THAP domain-containing protein 1-like isoform X2 [Photinus pyralis]
MQPTMNGGAKIAEMIRNINKFPMDENLKAQWIGAIHRENFTPTKHSVICGEHFKEADFLRKVPTNVLNNDAVPSVFNFSMRLNVKSPNQGRTLIQHPLPARNILLNNTQSDDCDPGPILNTDQEPSTSSSSPTSLKRKMYCYVTEVNHIHSSFRKLYFGDYSEEDLQCPKKAKMMWKLGKRQIDKKNKQLKILRMQNLRLHKKIESLENLVTHLTKKYRISEECESVLN